MTSTEIRQLFLQFFHSKQHQIVPSAPIVVKNDPTLLFINSGMAPFKDYFLGNKKAPYKRVVDSQKCLRVSGKHNDLEEVGVDTYHHTMFEMLGNWSFGDYFKKDAIAWSWELLTEVYKIDKDRLYVTVFEGDKNEDLAFDEEAYNEWSKWIAKDRILKGSKKDNFWEMGDTGPCGPCSEIHVDCRSDDERKAISGETLVNNDHPQVIEIWNNVFMQFNRLKDGTLQELSERHVDTGMGFERLVRVLQQKQSNYDTDIFSPTIKAIENIAHKNYTYSDTKQDISFRVISDHIRAISFTIADGQLPSNTGAGYVIRRILRRAVRYYYSYLNYKQPLLHQLVSIIATQFETVFPELKKQEEFVTKVILEEENTFLHTLEKGLRKIDDVIKNTDKLINGKEAFELYDTYGFPIDLTRLIASENGLSIDEAAFNDEMKQQKDRSRAATTIDADDWSIVNEIENTTFVGYEKTQVSTKIIKYRKVKVKGKELYQLVLEKTPFYAESGGQVGDKGIIKCGSGNIQIIDTKKENNLNIHFATSILPDLTGEVIAEVNLNNRLETSCNHSATHLIHAALRQVLGKHVEQKGSLVNEDVLRFDFSHFSKVSTQEIKEIETIVNRKIRENIPVVIKELPKEEALKLGAMALFGEKYGDTVRVVIIDPQYSIELCGGTHVGYTGMIGACTIISEAAVAAGIRRIEALTGAKAIDYLTGKALINKEISEALKSKDPLKSIEKLLEDKNLLEKRIEVLEQKEMYLKAKELYEQVEFTSGIGFLGKNIEIDSVDMLRKLANELRKMLKNTFVVLTAIIDNKAQVLILLDEELANIKSLDAAKIIKEKVAPVIKGGGGGQKTMANAGGVDTSNLDTLIVALRTLIS